ncbi:MAG: tetratricopeptide repeat protein [Rubricoccaceae bacterium]|nr:tetratricopeptide repeat protein [Rubricoccaceae bacterium]
MRSFFPIRHVIVLLFIAVLLGGADGCSSDPNVEGAKLYLRQGDYPAALEALETALTENPDNVEALVLKAEVLHNQSLAVQDATERRGLIEDIVSALNRADALEPGNEDAAMIRRAAWAEEMTSGSQAMQNSGGQNLSDVIQTFENAVYIQPDSAGGYFNLGLAHLVAGNTDQAIAPLEQVLEMNAGDENTYVYLGRALMATQNGSRALEVLEEGSEAFPESDGIRVELLNAYGATGQTQQAITAYEAALERSPEDPVLRYNYGSMLLTSERYDEAIVQLQYAADLDPENANVHYNLGAAYQNKATSVNTRLIDEEETDEANRLRAERDALLTEALPHLEEARSLTEASGESAADICNALFQVYAQLGREDEAREAGECAGHDMN